MRAIFFLRAAVSMAALSLAALSTADLSAAAQKTIQIQVSSEGYQPAKIELKSGEAVKLAFYRVDSKNCGDVVEFPALHIKKELPAGKTTVVELPAMQKGTLRFACGMGMMKGELVITQNGK